jgi:hypothetical protein
VAKTWKDYILRSGAPLEYEVARAMSKSGFEVSADLSYLRRELDGSKEHSVDIFASFWGEPATFAAHLLVECKYRSPEKSLLLLQDPNVDIAVSNLGGTVVCVDHFVPFYLGTNAFLEMEADCPLVYKGVEIHEKDNAVDVEFRRAIQQLRFGMPAALHRAVESSIFNTEASVDDTHAIFLAPVLVTNAPLLVLKEEVDIKTIENAEDLSEIAERTGMAVLFSQHGPEYVQHFHGAMQQLVIGDFADSFIRLLEKSIRKKRKKIRCHESPAQILRDMRGDDQAWCYETGDQFYIVNLDYLPTFLSLFLSGCRMAYKFRGKRAGKEVVDPDKLFSMDGKDV